ncbi:MAG: AbrB/MazE/SpoVT family DNA-binding domain-containing protein [Halobacteriales archaeon]|nr:AbrB/MazE/SpoVT family DNA-binding domain-containing protein [Halobacteriales archaeon]
MSGSDEGVYEDIEINDRGRLTIPKPLRDELHIDGGTTFTAIREGSDIRLVREIPALETLSTGNDDDEWRGTAFRDAGDATFGGE